MYDKLNMQSERLMRAVDTLRVSVLSKLKDKRKCYEVIDFDNDCFRSLFHGKGREAREKGLHFII